MVRRSKQIWMFLSVVLLATSTGIDASPVPTSETESETPVTTEEVTTSSTIISILQEDANPSSVSTPPPSGITTLHESDLYATTEYTPSGDTTFNDLIVLAKPSLSSEVPEVNRTEPVSVATDNTNQHVTASSHHLNLNQSESSDVDVQTTTISWISSTLPEIGTLGQDSTDTGLYLNVSDTKATEETGVSLSVPNVTTTHKPTSVRYVNSIGTSKENTEGILTDAPDLIVTEEYPTENVATNILPTDKTHSLKTVDPEVRKQTEVVFKQFTEAIDKNSQESWKVIETNTSFTEDYATSTEEAVKGTEGSVLLKPAEETTKGSEEGASPSGEKTKSTEEYSPSNRTKHESESLKEVASATEEVGEATNGVTIATDSPAKLDGEFKMQTIEESKKKGVQTDVVISSDSKPTKAEIFISSGYSPSKNYTTLGLENPRGSRHFTEEASKPQRANGTEIQLEINNSTLTWLATNTFVTLSPLTTPTSEQPELPSYIPLQNYSASGNVSPTEPSLTSRSTSDIFPTEVNSLNATSSNSPEEPVTILSPLDSNTPLPVTLRKLSVSNSSEAQNVSEPSLTHGVESENVSVPNVTLRAVSKNVSVLNGTHSVESKNTSVQSANHSVESKNVPVPNVTLGVESVNISGSIVSQAKNAAEPSLTYSVKVNNVSVPNVTSSNHPKITSKPSVIYGVDASNVSLSNVIPGVHENDLVPSPTHGVESKNISVESTTQVFPTPDKEITNNFTTSSTDSLPMSKTSKVLGPQSSVENTETTLPIDTIALSSPPTVTMESITNEEATGGTNMTIECSPEPVVSVFRGDLSILRVLALTACSLAVTVALVTVVLIRLRGRKQRDTSPSLQICGCLGRTRRAEITPRRAEVSEVKLRPGCNLATDADCRAGEGEEVPLALSAGSQKVPAPPPPVSMTVKPNGVPPLPRKPGDSPV